MSQDWKYFYSVRPSTVTDAREWAPSGEPVVPQYPHIVENVFLAIPSFQPAPYAIVECVDFIDLDVLAEQLTAHYPGLSQEFHGAYVLSMARAAMDLPVSTKVQIFLTKDTAKLKLVGTEEYIELWTEQPHD